MTIHILWHGIPLCGFTRQIPSLWPARHDWTSRDDREHATCDACKTKDAAMLAAQRRKETSKT